MDENENRIINQLKLGTNQVYKELFENYYPALTAFAFKYLGDADNSKEIVQDLFVSIYEKRSSLNISTSVKSYLYQSVKNRCLNYLDRNSTKEKHHKLILQQEKVSSETDERIIEIETEQEIARSIDKLPPRCREIFIMSRIDGKRNGQIADELQISIRTVETQISNALKDIRQRLRNFSKD